MEWIQSARETEDELGVRSALMSAKADGERNSVCAYQTVKRIGCELRVVRCELQEKSVATRLGRSRVSAHRKDICWLWKEVTGKL